MKETFNWREQAAKMCEDLSKTYSFLTEVNKELGKPRKFAKYFFKAINLELMAEDFRREAELHPTPEE